MMGGIFHLGASALSEWVAGFLQRHKYLLLFVSFCLLQRGFPAEKAVMKWENRH